jgi:DNA-binding transcriptional regulator YbjK
VFVECSIVASCLKVKKKVRLNENIFSPLTQSPADDTIAGMKLIDWMTQKNLGNQEVADMIKQKLNVEVNHSHVSRLKHGKRTPSLHMAFAIQDVSGGKVTLKEWRQ